MPLLQEFQCEVTQEGLEQRAAPYGGDISKLPPPDGLFQPGDQYTSASGCSAGDVILTAGQGAPGTSSGGRSPVVIGCLVFGIIIVVAVIVLLYRRHQRRFNPYSGSRL